MLAPTQIYPKSPILIADASSAIETLGWKLKYLSMEIQIKDAWKWHKKINELSNNKGTVNLWYQ